MVRAGSSMVERTSLLGIISWMTMGGHNGWRGSRIMKSTSVASWCTFQFCFCLQVRNPSSDRCLDTLGKKDDAPLGLYQCHGQGGNQVGIHSAGCCSYAR